MVEQGDGQVANEPDISQELIEAYKADPSNPEVITMIWRSFLPNVDIPDCHWSKDKITEPIEGVEGESQQGMMIYLPELYKGQEGLTRLGERFPLINNSRAALGKGSGIFSFDFPTGWYKVEANPTSPNLYATAEQLSAQFSRMGRIGQSLEVYILGSQFNKEVNDRYFDEDYSSLLLGSRIDKRCVSALFHEHGALSVMAALPTGRSFSAEGGRSMQLR